MVQHETTRGIDGDDTGRGMLTKPSFLLALALVVVIALLGVVVVVVRARSDGPSTTPPLASTPFETPATSPTLTPSVSPGVSVCGLVAPTDSDTTSAPTVTWDFQGTTAYPRSPEFGPAQTASPGYRYCFQHSAAGAVVMAANALVQGSDPEISRAWVSYVLSKGRYHDELSGDLGSASGPSEGTRLAIAGFRVLHYERGSAGIDLAVRVSSRNQNLLVSGAYELVWEDGDWKINADVQRPLDTATISDLAGYVPWAQ